ncbi:MAG TPA: SDR family NAD(P)-dependent oxidoreductase [Blastococcus sp.]|jgi:3-hydroxybutyrate dehydrogenase/3-oxoacyl-[acyl-carrier protein] reductase|nr:SDR family NAD(P)-dependent oxidoreductase [Blastococcus sp.]
MSGGGTTDIEDIEVVAGPLAGERQGRLQGRVAVLTQSTRSIGRGIAEAFLAEGASVVVSGRSEDKGKQALAEMGAGDRADFFPCDATMQDQVEALVDFAAERYGRLDIMVNNAGGTSGWALVGDLSDEAWQQALDWNLNACFWGTRRALRYMVDTGFGRIINMSSVESKMANKPMVSHYITNKHAMNGLTKATAFEYAQQGITCNAICPGAVETDLMKDVGPLVAQQAGSTYEEFLQSYANESMIKRLNTVEEVAACAVWLASDAGGGVTGAMINVDGGTSPW